VTQAQGTGVRRDSEQGLDDPRADAASRRRARHRVILTQPPPPGPEPRRPAGDEETAPSPSANGATSDERHEELLAEIDELVEGR
jgi:hypothetical protein